MKEAVLKLLDMVIITSEVNELTSQINEALLKKQYALAQELQNNKTALIERMPMRDDLLALRDRIIKTPEPLI